MSAKARSAIFLILSAILLLYQPVGRPQMDTAAITGRVLDPSGAAIPNATITALNVDTQIVHKTATNNDGLFNLSGLLPGNYRVEAAKPGFKTVIKPDLILHVQDVVAINLNMILGSVTESVTVEGGAPLVNTESASVGTVIDRDFVSQLPLNGRSFNTLLQLTPGVVVSGGAGQFNISGQRTTANYFTVDGVSVDFGLAKRSIFTPPGQSGAGALAAFNAYGGTSSLVSVDALQEFRVQTSSFAPEYGRTTGGQVGIETRSGTNQFHGDLFDYVRNDKLDANNWFSDAIGARRAEERQNDFGGVLGGPIGRVKTFFFLSYEGLRLRQPQTSVVSVPSLSIRTDPNTVAAAVPYLDAYPKPNGPDNGDGTAQFTGSYSNSITQDAGSARVDHTFSQKWSLFGRYNEAPSQSKSRTNSLNEVDTTNLNTKTFTLGVNGALKSTMIESVRANYSVQSDTVTANLDSFGGAKPLPANLLLPPPLNARDSLGYFDAFDTGFPYVLGRIANNRESQFNLLDNLAVSTGSHQLKFGLDYRRLDLTLPRSSGELQYLVFSTPGFASTAESNEFANIVQMSAKIRFHTASVYGQDAWRLGSRVVLTYGLRWELNPAPSGQDGTILGAWSNTDRPQITSLAPAGTPLWETTYDNFAPRVGIAYQVTSKGDFVLRGGGGLFYDLGTGSISTLGYNYPNQTVFISTVPLSLPLSGIAAVTPPPASLNPPYSSNNISAFSSTLNLPRSYQWNVAAEKSLWGTQALSVTYVGQAGRELLRPELEIQPNSNFLPNTQFTLTTNGDTSTYNTLQVQYRRPLSRGVQALLNYTWSHSLDTSSDDSSVSIPAFVFSPSGDRGSSSFDVRHNFTGAVTYKLPHIAKSQLLGEISKDWAVDAIVQVRSGFPINVTTTQVRIPGVIEATRPDLVRGVPFWLNDPTAPGGKRLNPAAFSVPQQPRQGALGRNTVPGFGLTQADMSVGRRFAFTERVGLQLRADFFNIFNHPNFWNPNAQLLVNRTTGQTRFAGGGTAFEMLNQGLGGLNALYQLGGPRSIQLSLKLNF